MIHYGVQTVTAPSEVVELDVILQQWAVVRTDDGGIWFTDGGDLDRSGRSVTPARRTTLADHPYATTWGFVVSGNTGSRVAWFSSAQPGQPELVVYDTRTLERPPVARCRARSYALLASVTERFAYWYDNPATVEDDVPVPQARLDLATGARERRLGSSTSRSIPVRGPHAA